MAQQDAIITQTITGTAEATSDQTSTIDQASVEPPDTDTASADDDEAPAPAPAPVAEEPIAATVTLSRPSTSRPRGLTSTTEPTTDTAPQ